MGKGIGCKIYESCGRDCTHCGAEEAKKKAKKMKPRKTTIFEGEQAEKLAANNLPNYETYKCPVCNGFVVDRSVLGIRIFNFCKNCGQALETEVAKELGRGRE